MTTPPASAVSTPAAAPEAPDPAMPPARKLRDALRILSSAPPPDPEFADDLEAIRASAGASPPDPWESA